MEVWDLQFIDEVVGLEYFACSMLGCCDKRQFVVVDQDLEVFSDFDL